MKIKLTNSELTSSFVEALKELSTIRTNSKVAYNTAKTIKSTNSAFEVYSEARKAILETRCTKGEDGKPKIEKNEYVFESDEVKKEVLDNISELNKAEVELEVFPVKLSELNNVEISANVIFGLKDFIQEDTETEKK